MKYRTDCPRCNGSGVPKGFINSLSGNVCPMCKGVGFIEQDNVETLDAMSTVSPEPDTILRNAIGRLKEVVVIGYTTEGEQYFSSSIPEGDRTLWHLRRAEHTLMKIVDEDQ